MWLIVLLLAISANGLPQGQSGGQSDEVCTTRECISISNRLFENMNLEADPCQDFHEFACGNFQERIVIPEDRGRWTSFSPTSEELYIRGRRLLEDEKREKSDFISDQLARDYYESCINEEKIEDLGLEPVKKTLKEIGGWPVIEGANWDPKGDQWFDTIPEMNRLGLGINNILRVEIATDEKNNSYRVFKLDQPSLGMSREYLINGFDDKEVQYYYDYMVNSAILMGAKKDEAKEDMKEALLFEIALANISAPREERRDNSKLYNPTTVGEFEELPGFPPSLKDYLNKLFVSAGVPEIQIENDEKLILKNPPFNRKLSDLLVKTSPRVTANYQGWRVFKSLIPYLNKEAKALKEEYNRKLKGVEKAQASWKRCVKSAGFQSYSEYSFSGAASSMYVRSYFKPEDKKTVEDMIRYVREAFDTMLNDLTWMDDETKKKALKKLKAMAQYIAYPDELLDPKALNGRYRGLKINPGYYYENAIAAARFWRRLTFRELRLKVDLTHWTKHQTSAVVNAFYNPDGNSMEFPAGILQGVFFNPKAPKYCNFGAIGSVIGHEITHGFDDQGRQRDYAGKLIDWWQGDTADKYNERASCIVNQYGNYTAKQINLKLNGINTQGENIADNGGIKEAYLGYNNYVKDNGPEPRLVGHKFTPNQLFWISFGHVWCAKFKAGTLKRQILTGVHSPDEFRIKGALSNNEDFAKDFKCPKGSPMNPIKKCAVW